MNPNKKSSLTAQAWGKRKRLLWKTIFDYINNSNHIIIKDINDFSSYTLLLKEIINELDLNNLLKNLDTSQIRIVESSIIAIYLVINKVPFSQNKIVEIAKFSDRQYVADIRKYLDLSLNTHREKVKKLFRDDNKQIMVCSRCGKVKDFSHFSGRARQCNGCRNTMNLLSYYDKKIQAIIYLEVIKSHVISINKFLKYLDLGYEFDIIIGCEKCGLDLNYLPALEFHHIDSKLKTIDWGKLRSQPIHEILNILKKEKCILLCGNCHKMETATIFLENKNLILAANSKNFMNFDRLIRRHMLKRILLVDFYGKVCFNCDDVDLNDIPIIQFHHLDPNLKKNDWHKLRNMVDLKAIQEILVKEKMIPLCANCHAMRTSSIFNEYKIEILRKYTNYCSHI